MRKITILFILFILLSSSTLVLSKEIILNNQEYHNEQKIISNSENIMNFLIKINRFLGRLNIFTQKDFFDNFFFSPEDIELNDDAFHGSDSLHFTEWWYFDSVFDNGYSVQIGIRIVGLINQGLIHVRLDIYKDGKLISHEIEPYILWDVFTSKEIPLVELNGRKIMEGYIDNSTGKWIYNLNIQLNKASAKLIFTGCTKGWKGVTPGGKWAVILPRANVKGIITYNNNTVNVEGIGYHDHNWDVTLFTGINFGWHWGKMNSESYTITWAKILTTRFWGQPLLVINEKDGDYINIESENINLQITEYTINQGMLVPNEFIIEANERNVSIHIDMEVIDIHHVRWVGIINYWRYHMQCSGYITIGDVIEPIDQIEITEFIRFR
jgi:hypothetical protein